MPVNQTGTITVKILAQDLASGNIGKFIGSLDKAAKQSGLLGWAVRGTAMSMGSMLNPAAMVAQGIGAVTDALQTGLTAYREDQVSQEKLRTALEANIQAWDGNTDAIERVIAKRMDLGFSDDAQRESLALLVAQVEDVNDALAIQRSAMDLARLKSISLADASTLLAKAYLGSTTGLQKMGIRLAKGASGMEAIAAVQQRVAGQAEAFAKTSAGAAERLDTKIGELQESIGSFIDGPATEFVGWLTDLVEVINGGAGDAAFKALGQRLLDVKKGVDDTAGSAEKGLDPIKSYFDGLQAFNDVLNPSADQARDFARDLAYLSDKVGVTEQAFMDMFFALKDGAKLGPDAAKQALKELLTSMILVDEQTSVTTPLLSEGWTQAMATVEQVTEDGALTVRQAVAGMKRAVRSAVSGTLTTMDDMKGPWIEAWKEYAEYAKDPFSEKNFARYMKRYSERAAQKAEEAAANHQGKVARKWTQLANAAKDPVVIAMARITGDVLGAIGVIATLKQQTAGLDNIMPSLTSVFGNDNDGRPRGHWKQTKNGVKWVEGRASGGPVMPGRTYRVGEAGEETLHMSAGGGGYVVPGARGRESSGGGNHVHLHFHGVVAAPSEAEGARLARVVAPHLQRELSRAGF